MVAASLTITVLLFLLLLVVPVFKLTGIILGLNFVLYNEPAVVITQAVLALAVLISILIMRPKFGRTGRVFWMLLPPAALLNAICFAEPSWSFSVIFCIVWSLACFIVYIKLVPDSAFKAISAAFSVIFAVAYIGLYIVFGLFMPATSDITVTESHESPEGTYVANELSVDGVFKDCMKIEVRKKEPESNAVLGYYTLDPVTVYEGEFYETEAAKIFWKDENVLVINGEEYEISLG